MIDATSRAQYYPKTTTIRVKLVTENGTGRLLGAQIVGREGAAKRVDVLAACIWNSMTVEDIISVDLGYAPPFSPVWDPVLVAARVATRTLTIRRRASSDAVTFALRRSSDIAGRTPAGPARP